MNTRKGSGQPTTKITWERKRVTNNMMNIRKRRRWLATKQNETKEKATNSKNNTHKKKGDQQ
jgi:hypothetical protein